MIRGRYNGSVNASNDFGVDSNSFDGGFKSTDRSENILGRSTLQHLPGNIPPVQVGLSVTKNPS